MAYQSSRNLHKIRFTTTSTMELHMQTYDHQPPRKTRKLPRGFLSTTIAIVKKTPGGLDHYIVFFPRAVWPVRPRHHDQALSFEFRYFERPHIDCGPTPISIPSALTPLPSGPTAATSPNATASMSSSSLRLSTSSVSRSTPSPTSTSSTGGMVPPPPPIAAPRFIHYHPNTPYLLHVARGGSLGAHDMLYYLERLFGHCLIDRTGTLTRRSPVKILRPLAPKLPDFNLSIDKICDARARHIIARAEREHRKIAVLWSGGIDSTSVAVSLLRNVPEANWKSIHILYTDRSKEENETFYEWLRVHTTMNYLGETINEIYRPLADSQSSSVFLPLIVTGELGDQIFGSMLAEYFYNTETTFKSKTNNKKQQSQPTPTRSTSSVTNERSLRNSCSVGGGKRSTATSGTHARVTAATSMMSSMMSSMLTKDDDLESEEEERGRLISKASSFMRGKHNQAWRKFFNDFLKHYKIVPPKAAPLMIAYIEPQIKKSPVPIVNAYDLLWWLNFSMKWQHVSLRIPLLMEYTGEAQSTLRMNRTVNFFDTDDFEQWSYHNHHLKMYDRSDWATYKGPLKEYIYAFNNDNDYRMNKLKERSLKVVKSVQGKKWHHRLRLNVIGVDEHCHPIQFGINSISFTAMMDKYGSGEQPLPATDVASTVLAFGKEWEATPFERAAGMEKMNEHGVVSTLTKIVNAPKAAPRELYKEQADWRYWFFTHRLAKDRDIVDDTEASPLFGSNVDGE